VAKREFNKKSLKRLSKAIESLTGLQESLDAQGIDLKSLKDVHVFGYGSLPDQPHYPPQSIEDAYLWGYSRDLCCKSVRSGTKKFPGLTLGLDKNDDGIVHGAILSYKNMSITDLTEMLKAFAKREIVADLPIYKFEVCEVEKHDGTKVHAITCVADPESMGYVGDTLSRWEKRYISKDNQADVTLRRKGRTIAEANGFLSNSKKHATAKSYFDRFVLLPMLAKVMNENIFDISDQTDEERYQLILEAEKELTEMTDPISSMMTKRDLAVHKENIRLLELAHSVYTRRLEYKKDMPDVVRMLEKAERLQTQGWREKRKDARAVRKARKPLLPEPKK